MKKFEQITTAAELLTYIKSFGRPTDTESICRMQDIIGHTAVEDLAEITRENKTWMMPLLFDIWNWEEATRFYNTYINAEYMNLKKQVKELAADAIDWKEAAEKRQTLADERFAKWEATANNLTDMKQEAENHKKRADDLENEVMRLKAMLFDYMTKAEA